MKPTVRTRGAALLLALIVGTGSLPVGATGIPTVDLANLAQTVMTAMENVAQTAKQVQQYQTQLQQYENMLQNTAAPAAYIWDNAQATINNLAQATNTLDYYKRKLGSVDSYLQKFQDVAYYRASPCFQKTGCSDAERAALERNAEFAAESQKRVNDAVFRGLDQQVSNLQSDAAQLRRLQGSAQGASGQMQALGYANQLASQQANQLLQIRGLLIAQQSAITTRMQAQADLEAKQQAAHLAATETRIAPTPNPKNWLEFFH